MTCCQRSRSTRISPLHLALEHPSVRCGCSAPGRRGPPLRAWNLHRARTDGRDFSITADQTARQRQMIDKFHPRGVRAAAALALALRERNISLGQVASFLTEVPKAEQIAFAALHGVDRTELTATASAFAQWSGQSAPLAA